LRGGSVLQRACGAVQFQVYQAIEVPTDAEHPKPWTPSRFLVGMTLPRILVCRLFRKWFLLLPLRVSSQVQVEEFVSRRSQGKAAEAAASPGLALASALALAPSGESVLRAVSPYQIAIGIDPEQAFFRGKIRMGTGKGKKGKGQKKCCPHERLHSGYLLFKVRVSPADTERLLGRRTFQVTKEGCIRVY
jgi:hypothetical protein